MMGLFDPSDIPNLGDSPCSRTVRERARKRGREPRHVHSSSSGSRSSLLVAMRRANTIVSKRFIVYCGVQYAKMAMEAEKTVGLTFRVTPRMKRMLEAAANYERRSLTNMFEVLVDEYCRHNGLLEPLPDESRPDAHPGEHRV
ncbi:hypothetical protein LJR161_004401 [Variovorax paradoxus]|uniref:hypothetical protein n=1 Tax=Variovorax paradoxus TaxID=34073 RepID=UPI003ECCE646